MCFLSRDSVKRSSAGGGGAKGEGGLAEETRLVFEAANMAFCFWVWRAPPLDAFGAILKSGVVQNDGVEDRVERLEIDVPETIFGP